MEANLFMQQEAPVTDLALVGMILGADPNNSMPWSGTISDTGWIYSLSAPYQGGTLTASYAGSYAASTDTETWSGSGMFTGPAITVTWQSNGSYTDATQDGFFSDIANLVLKVAVSVFTGTVTAAAAGTEAAGFATVLGTPAAVLYSAI